MAISAPVYIGSATALSSAAPTTVITVGPAGVPAGALVILRFGILTTVGDVTAEDSQGNAYQLALRFGPSSSANISILTGVITTPLTAGDTITISHANVGNRAAYAEYVTGADLSGSRVVASASGNGSSTTPSVGVTPTAAGQLVVGGLMFSNTGTLTGDSDTTDGTWSTLSAIDNGGGTTRVTVAGQAKLVGGPAAQTWNVTNTNSRPWAAIALVIASAPAGHDEVEAHAGVVSGARVDIHVDRQLAALSGLVSGSRVGITVQLQSGVSLHSGVEAGSRITISIRGPGDAVPVRSGVVIGARFAIKVERPVATRSGLEAGSRVSVQVDRQLAVRNGVEAGSRITIVAANTTGVIETRSGVMAGSRIAIKVDVPVRIRAGIVIGQRLDIQRWRNLPIRSGVVVGAREGYVGPGTGIVAFDADPEARRRAAILALQAGDIQRVVIPRGETDGMTGLVRVLRRTRTDRDALPSFEVQFTSDTDPGGAIARRSAGQTVRPVEGAELTRRLRERLGRR